MGTIQGIGVDVVDVNRMKAMLEEHGERFVERVFTAAEASYCRAKKNPHEHYAARFAAKEAVSKAMATGWAESFNWKDVEVVNEPSGAPTIVLYNTLAALLDSCRVHISISHTESTVVAFAVIERLEGMQRS
jgi:holo-[acyl-carrier protein] synthase